MDLCPVAKRVKSRILKLIPRNGANQEYQIQKTPVGKSGDEDEV
jgi:hypothetical protein